VSGLLRTGVSGWGVTAIATAYSYGPATKGSVRPLPHSAVLVITRASDGLVIDRQFGGDIEVTITDATANPQVAHRILNSVWYP
jgi:hypothetical protein